MRTLRNRLSLFMMLAPLVSLGALAGLAAAATSPAGPVATGGSSPIGSAPAAAPAATAADRIAVTLANPLAAARPGETIALSAPALAKIVPGFDVKKALVLDSHGAPVLSQVVDEDGDETPDEVVFQSDFAPRETKTFQIVSGTRIPAAPSEYKAYGRFVRERHDDFAWENDRVAHRVYGPALETYPKEMLISSGIDVWVKRVPKLLVNEWYMTDDYHQDHGEGADFYSVGKTRGCGGTGIWTAKGGGGDLAVSHNFATSRVLANGPIRLVFELTYAPWDAGGARLSETKRVTLDAGMLFNRMESTFTDEAAAEDAKKNGARRGIPPTVAIGIAKHPGNVQKFDRKVAWQGDWEPLDGGKSGHLGCAVMLAPGAKAEAAQTPTDYLLIASAPARGPLVYYVGSAWSEATSLSDLAAWHAEAQRLSSRLAAPITVKLAASRAR